MNQLLHDRLYKDLFVYLDDIIIWSDTKEELREIILWAVKKLEEVGLKLNGEKCIFLTKRLEILGHYVKQGYLLPLTERLPWLKPKCKNLTEVRALVGALSYFRKFVPRFREKLKPVLD